MFDLDLSRLTTDELTDLQDQIQVELHLRDTGKAKCEICGHGWDRHEEDVHGFRGRFGGRQSTRLECGKSIGLGSYCGCEEQVPEGYR